MLEAIKQARSAANKAKTAYLNALVDQPEGWGKALERWQAMEQDYAALCAGAVLQGEMTINQAVEM